MCAFTISATNTLCAEPGLKTLPKVPANTAAPAISGLTPAAIITGISVAPTAAEQPAAEGIAILIKYVSATTIGINKNPIFPRGLVSKFTRARSHSVNFITKAKPILAQIALISPALVIYEVKAPSPSSGFRQSTHSTKPTPISTVLVSFFMISKATTATIPASAKSNLNVCTITPFKF